MPVPVPRSAGTIARAHHQLNGNGYNPRDAAALMRLAFRWRDRGRKPMLIPNGVVTLSPPSLRIYFYNARRFIREHPETYPLDVQNIIELMGFKITEHGILVHLPLRFQLAMVPEAAQDVSANKSADYHGRKLYIHWISQHHAQGDYKDIPGEYTADDLAWFKEQAEEYKDLMHIEFSENNIRVIWDAESVAGPEDESPW